MKMRAILIVTHQRGFEADPIIDLLRERKADVFRFNCDFGSSVSSSTFYNNASEILFECDGRHIHLREIAVGWCQQLPPYLGQPSDKMQCLQGENLWTMHSALFDLLPVTWFNRPSNVVRASNKLLQLDVARRIGLPAPETLISNRPEHIRKFANGRTIIAKNLATPWVITEGETQAAYTRIVQPEWLEDDKALSFCPVIYQVFHPRKKDYRVVMVGGRMYAACCESNEHQYEDVRKGTGTGESYVACTFDSETLSLLRVFMKQFSLEYCAADFIEDENGKLLFLEVNTCGAWWWMDKLYNGEICKAIADFLCANRGQG
jgi:hypothetical protein